MHILQVDGFHVWVSGMTVLNITIPIAHPCHPEAHYPVKMTMLTVGMRLKKLLMGEGSQREVWITSCLRTGTQIAQASLRFFGHT